MSILEELGIDPEQIDEKARIGEPVQSKINDEMVIDIQAFYTYKGKNKQPKIRIIPGRQISTITKKTLLPDGKTDFEVIKEGMKREDIEKFFPPYSKKKKKKKKGYPFDLQAIIRSIILEAFIKREIDYLPPSNVRGFYYTHLIHIIQNELGMGETDVVKTTINHAWEDLIISGLVTYEGMKITSGKEDFALSVVKDSPFANLIIAIEKEDKFKPMQFIPRLFHNTLITGGGQPSRAYARKFVLELRDKARVSLDQTFYMCIITDLDPAGYYIQETFINQIQKAIEYYGGNGRIESIRLFVRKDQVTPELLEHDAVPAYDKPKNESARKAQDTKWRHFCELTDGGIYKDVPRAVAVEHGAIKANERKDEESITIRAKLELNAFPDEIIADSVIRQLLKIIEDTSDESMIMIPEIMRIFEEERKKAMDHIYLAEHQLQIQPKIDDFLHRIEIQQIMLKSKSRKESKAVDKDYESKKAKVDKPYDEEIEELEAEADERVPDELDAKAGIQEKLRDLLAHLKQIEKDIEEKTQDILDKIEELNKEREEELKPLQDERDEALKDVEKRKEYRIEQLEKFGREKATAFNPMEVALKDDIKKKLSQDNMPFFFTDIEQIDEIAGHIAKMLTNPDSLITEKTSCFEHDFPVFKEKELLRQASKDESESVEPYRKGFTSDFLGSMMVLVLKKAEEMELEYEIGEEVELEDFRNELRELVEHIEKDIEEGKYKEPEEEEEDDREDNEQ